MRMFHWLERRNARRAGKQPARRRPARRSFLLSLEPLEERLAPCATLLSSAALAPALVAQPASAANLQAPFQVGDEFVNVYAVNRQSLVPDPVTDPAAWNYSAARAPTPRQSPWGSAIVLPEVSYDAIMTGTAAQPDLNLPNDLIAAASLTNGITFQTWFQAKNPGALLTADLTQSGSTALYQAPLVYIDFSGKLVAGLFDPTPLTVNQLHGQSPTVFSWKDADGLVQIAAANPLVSQKSVVDNTWHHVAFVASDKGQALYLDGLLQGTSRPLNHDRFTSTSSSPVSTLNVPLSGKPVDGVLIRGSIWEPGTTSTVVGNGYQAYTFELRVEGQTGTATLTPTYNEVNFNGAGYPINSNPPHVVASVVYNGSGATPTLEIVLNSSAPANALTVRASYATESSAYNLAPNTNGVSFSGALSVGGSIVPEPANSPYPELNYPQGYIGTIDEVALWTTQLTQAQVQAAMTAPISQNKLSTRLAAYFNFDLAPVNRRFSNLAPGGGGKKAQGPTTGTSLVRVLTTIPTDPFPNATPLPGTRAWGLGLMTPLASSSQPLAANRTTAYKAVLAAGDQLGIKVPEDPEGTLTVTITTDTGQVIVNRQPLEPGSTHHLGAVRTGIYQLRLTWAPNANEQGRGTNVTFVHLPGPLNSLMELVASYTDNVSASDTLTRYAYSDADLAGANPAGGTAPAGYWPLWSDTDFFPPPRNVRPGTWAAQLNEAYDNLVRNIPSGAPLSDFANVINTGITLPIGDSNTKGIQQWLDDAYKQAYGVNPPALPSSGPFPVTVPRGTPAQDAVYRFLYNSNLLRQNFYEVLTGGSPNSSSLSQWVQEVINGIIGTTVPVNIKNTILGGLPVPNLTLNAPDSATQSSRQIILSAVERAAGAFLGSLVGLALGPAGPLVGPAFGAAAGSLFSSFGSIGGGSSTLNATVSVTPITNNLLDYTKLDNVATSLTAGLIQQWSAIQDAVNNSLFIQSVMTNYGLLEALQQISSAPLSEAPTHAVDAVLTEASWRSMIPAVFKWGPVQPYDFPSGDGHTTYLVPQTVGLDAMADDPVGIVSADFNGDKFPDLATANHGSDTVSVLLNKGQGGGFVAHTVSQSPPNQDGPNGAWAIAVGDFDSDGHPDLAVATVIDSAVSVLLNKEGTGAFNRANVHTISLVGSDGSPTGITVADFNQDGHPDIAVANEDSDNVNVLLNNGDGTSFTANRIGLSPPGQDGPNGAQGIVSGDFNSDGRPDLAVADADDLTNSAVSILLNQGGGTSYSVASIDLGFVGNQAGIAAGDFNGDGRLDLAVVLVNGGAFSTTRMVSVLTGNGQGGFTPTTIFNTPTDTGGTIVGQIAARDWNGDKFQDLVVGLGDERVSVFLNRGNGNFFTPISYDPDNLNGTITTGDFNRDGLSDIAYTTDQNEAAILYTGTVGNFATFVPDSAPATNTGRGRGHGRSGKAVQPAPLAAVLDQLMSLQGSNAVKIGPYDSTSLIQPPTSTPPNYMAHISLPYAPESAPLSITSPGWFLTMTPATMQQTADGSSYTESGNFITGWNLFDSNGNPIALATAQQLFGLPILPTDGATGPISGADLTPINAQTPIVGLNGGWYYAVQPASGAATTWAEAFFAWGLGTSGYSSRILVPNFQSSSTQTGKLPGTSASFSDDFQFTLTFSPATKGPPKK